MGSLPVWMHSDWNQCAHFTSSLRDQQCPTESFWGFLCVLQVAQLKIIPPTADLSSSRCWFAHQGLVTYLTYSSIYFNRAWHGLCSMPQNRDSNPVFAMFYHRVSMISSPLYLRASDWPQWGVRPDLWVCTGHDIFTKIRYYEVQNNGLSSNHCKCCFLPSGRNIVMLLYKW